MAETLHHVPRSGRLGNPSERLAAVQRLGSLDVEREEVFECLTKLAAEHYGCQIAVLSMHDRGDCWIKCSHGVKAEELAGDTTLFAAVFERGGVVAFADLMLDETTKDCEAVAGSLGLRFFAAATMKSRAGSPIAVLSIADPVARDGAVADDFQFLEQLASVLRHLLERREAEQDAAALTRTLHGLVEGAVSGRGDDLLRWTVRHLVESKCGSHAFLCEVNADATRAELMAGWGPDGALDVPPFALEGTPSAALATEAEVSIAAGVRAEYPRDKQLGLLGAEGYAGVAIRNASGRCLGLLYVLSDHAMPEIEHVLLTMRLFSARLAGELENRTTELRIQQALESTVGKLGEDFFRALAKELSVVMSARYAFVCESSPDGKRATSLAFTDGGQLVPNFEFDLLGTPCGEVYVNSPCRVSSGLREEFASFEVLKQLGAESYLGVRARDSRGAVIGHIGVMHDEARDFNDSTAAILRLFAARAGAEMERRRGERRRLNAERALQEAHKEDSLGTLAGGVAHDFNNLLVGILGNIELAVTDAEVPDQARVYLHEIHRTARRAPDLANQMLAYSGRGAFVVEPNDPCILAREIEGLLRASVPKKIALEFACSDGLSMVECDTMQMRQILINLVQNASEAIGGDIGRIRISVSMLPEGSPILAAAREEVGDAQGQFIMFEVEDNGPGMDSETLSLAFDPYFTTKAGRRGLGLAAVRGIVRGHRGILTVRSEPGMGATFRALLPSTGTTFVDRPRPVGMAPEGGLALVVDDESDVRSVSVKMLERLGYTVISAREGEEGVQKFSERRDEFAFVLLDVAMPRMDGREALAAIRALAPNVPIVMMSGYDEKAVLEVTELEHVSFLKKPFTAIALGAALGVAFG